MYVRVTPSIRPDMKPLVVSHSSKQRRKKVRSQSTGLGMGLEPSLLKILFTKKREFDTMGTSTGRDRPNVDSNKTRWVTQETVSHSLS